MRAKQRSILIVVQNSPVPLSSGSPTLRIYSAGATKIPIPTCYTAANSVVLLLRNGSCTSPSNHQPVQQHRKDSTDAHSPTQRMLPKQRYRRPRLRKPHRVSKEGDMHPHDDGVFTPRLPTRAGEGL